MWIDDGEETEADQSGGAMAAVLARDVTVRRFTLTAMDGPAVGETWSSSADKCAVGSHPSNDLVIQDRMASRFHIEIRVEGSGFRIRDLESTNGTLLDGVPIVDAWLRDGSLLRLGQTTLSFRIAAEGNALRLSPKPNFGSLVGESVPMRAAFAILELAASSDSTLIIEGETGTGKEEAAHSVHEGSARKDGPFIVVDCSAIPDNLLESELFGHEKGAFTGAVARRTGAFEAANGGSIFLDEIGELQADLQPKLLRVLENRTVRPVGSTEQVPIDVRVIAATNRSLRAEVNRGNFRSDLYYRLAVITVEMPSLARRPENIPMLAHRLLSHLGADEDALKELLTAEFRTQLQRSAWPGNVRQLRNYLEQALVLREAPPLLESSTAQPMAHGVTVDASLPYSDARQRALESFERQYLESLLSRSDGNVSQAARSAGLNRVYLHRLLRKHRLRG